MTSAALARRIRILLWVFVAGLVLSGATAIPLETEIRVLLRVIGEVNSTALGQAGLVRWLTTIRCGLVETNAKYPFMAYGTDWLAFGHFVIAIAFWGPLREPTKNVWVVEFGMIACVLVIPFALGMGALRSIPLGWRLVDCSFGVLGIVPLWLCRTYIKELAARSRDAN